MIIIKHRVNSINELKKLDSCHGVEIDLRTLNNEIILHHDAFENGVLFSEWLSYFNHKFLILNVKEDGLESKIINLLRKHKIDNYFFLDQPFPTLLKCINSNIKSALRVSEYEWLNKKVLSLKPEYIWLDSFNFFNIENYDLDNLRNTGAKICLVSPELQNRIGEKAIEEIRYIKADMSKNNLQLWGVCTKLPNVWRQC